MSFSFHALGTKEEVAAQLKAIEVTTGENRFNQVAAELRDLFVRHVEAETAAPGGGYEYRYAVSASGHGGGNVPLSLNVEITPHWVPKITAELAESPAKREVLAAIDKLTYDLGFAAPETHADRIAAMRIQVEAAFDTVVDADIVDDETDPDDED